MHAAPGFLSLCHEGPEFLESVDLLGGIGVDEVKTAIDRVTVGIDEAGEKAFAIEIGAGGVGSGFCNLRQSANSNDLVAVNGDGFCVGILGDRR